MSDRVGQRALRVPFIVVCAGCAGLLVTIVSAARTDVAELGGGLVFNTILGFGMMASGLLLISGAVGAKRLVSHGAAEGARRNSLFFGVVGVIGVVTTLYGAAVFFGV
jgi:hypothetical protein